jgi:hypothetical protein
VADYIERWYYDITPLWRLPYPDELPEEPWCIARGIGPFARSVRRLFLPKAPTLCCWYHSGSWAQVSEAAIGLVEAKVAEGLVGEELVDAVTERVREVEAPTKWFGEAVMSLVDGGEPINIGSVDDWRDGERFYIGGRHRALAMMQQGVRRTGDDALGAPRSRHRADPPRLAARVCGTRRPARPLRSVIFAGVRASSAPVSRAHPGHGPYGGPELRASRSGLYGKQPNLRAKACQWRASATRL